MAEWWVEGSLLYLFIGVLMVEAATEIWPRSRKPLMLLSKLSIFLLWLPFSCIAIIFYMFKRAR